MMQSSKNFPRLRNQGYQSSRTLKTRRRLLVVSRVNKRGTYTQTQTLSCANFPEGCQSSGLAENESIKRIESLKETKVKTVQQRNKD